MCASVHRAPRALLARSRPAGLGSQRALTRPCALASRPATERARTQSARLEAMIVPSTETVVRALIGGALIGVAASLALLLHGRIAGISGTLGRALAGDGGRGFRLPFLAGLIAVGAVAAAVTPSAFGTPIRSTWMLAVAGLLVGVGTGLSNGCTSGHGVCGMARLSPRSLVAVLTFMATAAITVAIVGARS
jgi:uncharacterized protein